MMLAADCATRADFVRAAERRLAVRTARGHYILTRWDAPRTRGTARLLLNNGSMITVKCSEIEAVEVP